MKNSFFARRRHSAFPTSSILFALGGVVVGAGLALFLTPTSGGKLRAMVRDLFTKNDRDYGVDDQLADMENEGGVGHEVAPPMNSGRDAEIHKS